MYMSIMAKIKSIKKINYDPASYGPLKNALAGAKDIDPSIKLDDVKAILQ